MSLQPSHEYEADTAAGRGGQLPGRSASRRVDGVAHPREERLGRSPSRTGITCASSTNQTVPASFAARDQRA
jgi:hypothetical protein